MKKLILSVTLVCFSLLGKKGIVDAYNNIPTKPQNNVIQNIVPAASAIVPPAVPSLDAVTDLLASPANVLSTVTDLINVSTITDILPKLGNLNLIPLAGIIPNLDIVPIPDITAIPNIVADSPVLAVTNGLPIPLPVVENVITSILGTKKAQGKVACYKAITDEKTYFVFAPCALCKNPVTDLYGTIVNLVATLAEKLQELLGQTTNSQETALVVYEAPASTVVEDKA